MEKITKMLPLALLVPILAACGGTSSSGLTLTVWEDESNIEMLQELATEFIGYHKQHYPLEAPLTINFEKKTEAQAIGDLQTVGETGNGPDIAAITSDTLSGGIKSNLVATPTYGADLKTFDANAVSNATFDGDVMAYPITAESQVIMYDKRQVSDPSIFDSFDNLKASGKKLAWDAAEDDCAYYLFGLCNDSVLFGANGTEATKLTLATTQTVANLVSFYNDYSGSIVSSSVASDLALIDQKTVVGLVSSPFILSDMINNFGAENVGMHVLPKINGKDLRPFSGYKEYIVSSYSKQPSLAHEFADYLVSEDAQMWRLNKKNYLPTRSSAEIDEMVASNAYAKVYKASYDLSKPMPTIDQMSSFWSPMISCFQGLWAQKGAVTSSIVTTALNTAQKSILG